MRLAGMNHVALPATPQPPFVHKVCTEMPADGIGPGSRYNDAFATGVGRLEPQQARGSREL